MVTIIVFRTSSSSTKESSSLVWQFKHDNNVCESYIAFQSKTYRVRFLFCVWKSLNKEIDNPTCSYYRSNCWYVDQTNHYNSFYRITIQAQCEETYHELEKGILEITIQLIVVKTTYNFLIFRVIVTLRLLVVRI